MGFKRNLFKLYTLILIICLASCSEQPAHQAQGYIEGRYTYMATSVSGVLEQLHVQRGAKVKQGDVLFKLEQQPQSDAYTAAKENLNQAIAARDAIAANLDYAKITYERYKILVPQKALEVSRLDNARSTYESTIAQLAQANATIASSTATLQESAWTKDQKIITAPVDAIVFDTYYRLGEYTQAGQPIVSLLAASDIKVVFYVFEAILGELKLGNSVSVQCNGCDRAYVGKISFISPSAEYTPPVIYSTETNAKLIYRIEAEFEPKIAYHLHPGQPVTVKY